MGLFSKLFGGGEAAPEAPLDENGRALRDYFREKLPKNYVNSPKYAVSITQNGGDYTARITLDMLSDGSDYSGFGPDDYAGLADMESGYVFDNFLADPPVPVFVTLDLVFGKNRKITVEKGKTPR